MAENVNQPFNTKDVLYSFVPNGEERGLFDEFVAVRSLLDPLFLIFYAKNRIGGEWAESGYFSGAIIAHLLKERDALIAERDFYEIELWHVEDQALDGWVINRAHAALEQGAKIRGES